MALLFLGLSFVFSTSDTEAQELWPDRWLAAGVDFGTLAVLFRFTDDCGIDPGFEIVERPNIQVSRTEIFDALQALLHRDSRKDFPQKALSSAFVEVFGTEKPPDRALEKSEYDAVMNKVETLGPWPTIRTIQLGNQTIRCTFDAGGALVEAEESKDGGRTFGSVLGSLDKQDPVLFRWEVDK